ncbi:hypothetical protein LTR95_009151 [Oleoguttula sp. CCFEE 5521]
MPSSADDGDLAKAFLELAKGERTAAALEQQLTSMEAKIEALLAQAEQDQEAVTKAREQGAASAGAETKAVEDGET